MPKICLNFLEELLGSKGAFYNANENLYDDEGYNKNNKRQQLSEGFVNSCYKIASPILLQKLINNFAVCKHCSGTLLLVEDGSHDVLETRTTYLKKESHFFIDQRRTCDIFMLCCIKSIFKTNLVISLVYS